MGTFCRITGHSRNLPRPNYFPILPPISPAEAKRYRTTSCRITCNFNPNHHYQPITKLIEESVVKCRITEKSVYEYKFFLQPSFVDSSNSNESERRNSNEFYYYELDDKVLVLPKSVEKELNRGAIRDVQISEDNRKIGFKYLNRIKEYDLVIESTDKLKDLTPLKGKGLKKATRKRRKRSALLGDLKSVFEQKEKLAEIAEKKAMEKIQPDTNKIELVKSKIISGKAPIIGYVDHNNKFTEISNADDLPKHVTKGQMHNGVFTPGEYIADNGSFIPGKYIDNVFTPGIMKDHEFLPGSYIEKEIGGKLQKKFIPGKVFNGVFTTGQMFKTIDGSKSEFVPGQVLTLENNEKKFVPGLLIEHEENDTLELKFVPGQIQESNNSIKFIPGELIETNEGLRFVCEKVFTDSFEIQTFDNDFDFDLEDVRAAAAICDNLNDFVKQDVTSSFDQTDADSNKSVSLASGKVNGNYKQSLDAQEGAMLVDDEQLQCMSLVDVIQELLKHEASVEVPDKLLIETSILSEKIKLKAISVIQQICSEMNVTSEEMASVIAKIFEEFTTPESLKSMNIDKGSTPTIVFERLAQKISSTVEQTFTEMKSLTNNEAALVMQKAVDGLVKSNALTLQSSSKKRKDISKTSKTTDLYAELNQNASAIIQQVCSEMKLSKQDTALMVEKVLQEFIKQDVLQSTCDQIGTEVTPTSLIAKLSENLQLKTSSVIQQVVSEMKLTKQQKSVAMEKVLEGFSKQNVIQSVCIQIETNIQEKVGKAEKYELVKEKAFSILQSVCSQANMTPQETSAVVDKLFEEIMRQEIASDSTDQMEIDSTACDRFEKLQEKTTKVIQQIFSEMKLSPQQIEASVETVLESFRKNKILQTVCDHMELEITVNSNVAVQSLAIKKRKVTSIQKVGSSGKLVGEGMSLVLKESPSSEKVLEECRKLLVEGYQDEYCGENEVEAADMLKDHVENQLTRELNEALLLEALHLAQVLGKMEVVRELESVFQNESSYETIVNDEQVLFILRQLVILKKLMAADKGADSTDDFDDKLDLDINQELIRDAQILTEYVFANEERERYFTPPCDDITILGESPLQIASVGNHFQREGATVYMEEESTFFSSEETTHAKRARLATDDLEFDKVLEPVELLDSSCARHKIEMGRMRHQKKSKISLKSADELQSTTSEQLAQINREATLRELIETEEEFVRDLNFVMENYYKVLGSGNNLAKYRELFGSLKAIYEFHQGILLEGFRYYVDTAEPKMIGRTFLRLERYFDNHAEYISEEEPNAQALLRDDMEISEYFEELTQQLRDEKRLSDHLKLPLQRINDYQLILEDLIDTQRILKEETSDLEKALDLLLLIPQKVSDKKFLSNIEGFHGNVFHLGRLLRHDWFTVTRPDLEEVKQRYAFLFKTRILVTKVRKISEERSVFILKDIIKLPEYQLEQVDDTKFILRGCNRTYIFETQSGSASNEWTDIIQQTLQPETAALRKDESRQLRREGSLRKSQRQTSLEPRRLSTATETPTLKPPEPLTPITKKGVTIQEISLQEAETIEENHEKQVVSSETRTSSAEKIVNTGTELDKKNLQSSRVSISEEQILPVLTEVTSPVPEDKQPTNQSPSLSLSKQEENKQSTVRTSSVEISDKVTIDNFPQKTSDDVSGLTAKQQTQSFQTEEIEIVGSKKTEKAERSVTSKQVKESTKEETSKSGTTKQASGDQVSKTITVSENKIEDSSATAPIIQVFDNKSVNPQSRDQSEKINKQSSVDKIEKNKTTSVVQEKQIAKETRVNEIEGTKADAPSSDETRQLRRRSSVIRRQSSVAMASEKSPIFVTPLRSVECEPGDAAGFECVTEVPVIISWLKGNRPLDDKLADRIKITSNKNKHTLSLLNCRDEDAGLYTAKITDEKFGVATSSAVLTVHELTAEERQQKIKEKNSPQFFLKFRDTELLKDTRVSFIIDAKGNPAPTLTFYHDGMILQTESERMRIVKHPDDTYEFSIDKISDEDAGEYSVKAENKHGVAEFSAKVTVVDEKELFKGIEGKRLLNPGEEPSFDWYLNGRPFTPDEKLKVMFREDEDTLALVFKHVTPDDAGLYTCIAQTSGGKISCSAELTVQGAIHQLLKEPSAPVITAELTDTEVSVGGSAMMELKVTGFPKPTVTWYKNGKEELLAGGRFRFLYEDEESIALIVKSVTKEDAGLYTVRAINDLGEAETKGHLIVKAPPRFVKKMVDMACMTEEKLKMEVVVEGSPKPEVKWYKDGQLIIASERIKFTELEDGRFQITIERVTLEDSGAYSVVASNAIGQMSEFWGLVAQQPAKIIRKLPNEFITDLGSKGNQLNFSVQGVPDPTVNCTSSAGKQLKVDNLGGGEYRVNFDCTERQDIKVKAEAKNEFGTDSSECQVFVRRSAKIVSQLKDLEIKEGEDVTLKVKVDCYPKPSKVNWFIDGIAISGKKYETSDSGDEYALKIKGVEKNESSNKLKVQVKVENELGQDECSASITIKSKPTIKKGLDAKYRLVETSKNQELNVEVDGSVFPEPKGTWYHNGVEVNADARIKITKKSSETYNLTFNVVKYEDAGEWSFKAENEVGEVWTKTTVIVEGKPIFSKGLPQTLEIIESEKMELDVMVQDFCEENVKITWTLDSNIKLESSEVFDKGNNCAVSKIVFVPTSGAQKLTVSAQNKHGETETMSELVCVNLVPPTIKKPLEKEILFKDGQKDVRLKVEVDGMPSPKIAWYLNGELLKSDGSNELIIPVFSSANVGQYSAEAVNVAGKARTDGAVKMLQSRPTFVKGLEPSYEFKEGLEDLVLSVDVDGSPIPIVTWMKDGQEIDLNDPRVSITNADGKSTLRVKNIDPKDKGRYSVSLKNPNGACESSTNVAVKPTPRAPLLVEPLQYPKDVNKKEKLEIKTKIDGEPMPSVTFYFNDVPLNPSLWKVFPDGSVILTIDNVQPENQGVYTLKLENEVGEKKVDTEPINVHEPPQRPRIDPPLNSQRVVEGLPLLLKASLKGHPLPELTLEKDGIEIKDFNYDRNAKAFEYSKPKSQVADAGTYKLIAKNSEGQVESEGRVDVVSLLKEGPKYEPKFVYELCDKTVDEGNELVLFAKVDGNPLPSIQWQFNGSPIDPAKFAQSFDGEKASIRLPIAERENQGLYKCILVNDEGTAESASNVGVNKIYRPPSFVQKFTDQEQIPACDSKFGARVSGIPVPTAKWFKDGKEIVPSDKFKMKQEGDLVQLHVRNCDDSDRAIYTCLLTNSQGSSECKAKLDVVKEISNKPRGEIPYFLKTIGNTEVYPGMTAKFTACVGGFPDPEFEWFRNNSDKIFASDRIKIERDGAGSGLLRLVIRDVDIGDIGDYRLRIWNQHGDAECSAYLKYDTLSDLNKQKLGDLYSGFENTRPTAIPSRPLITRMSDKWMTLKWNPCLPHVSRIPCTYLVEMCPADQSDNWTTIHKGLKNNYCDIEFPNPNMDYKYRIRVQWGQHHVSDPSPYAITMRNKFDTRPPQWKPQLVPSIPRNYDLSRPPHDGYTHAPRFLNTEKDFQYAQLGHPATVFFYVYGYPKPTLKFFKDGRDFNPEHTFLDNGLISIFVNRMTDDAEGDYECEAKNPHGIARQKVLMKRADHPRFISRPQEVYVLARRGGKISARVYGIPVPHIKIYKDWHLLPLTSDTRVRLQIVEIDQFTIDVTVYVDEALMRDEGLYSIVATNVAGSVHSSAMIHIEESESDYNFYSNLKGKDVRFRSLDVRNYYDYGDEIGRGTQGIHHHVVERASGSSFASKTMITKYDPRRKEWVESEYNIWNGLNHRHISRLHDALYFNDSYYFISDICTGGDIFNSLISRESFTEYDICCFIRQMLEGLEYLHVQNHIAHLSLTPLDLLMTHVNSDILRIIDFGLARKNFNRPLEYGHPEYVSPEIVRGEKNVGPWSDMWSVGIITYVLLTGHSPFLGLNDRETLENVKNGAWSFGDRFGHISDRAQDFIKRLIVYDFKDRMDIQTALDHSWFHMIHEERTTLTNIQRDIHSSYYYKLKAWNENASCRGIYRRNPLETAYTDPSKMVYPPHYIEEDDYRLPIPTANHLKLDGYPRPEIGDFVNESHYQSGDETYLLQLRDPDFPARLRQYMKVAAHHSPSFQFQVYNTYCERNLPTIRERRKFTDVMDEEVDDEKKSRITNYGEGPWNSEPRRLRHEVGSRSDTQAEADALISMKRDGKEPVFREKPNGLVNVRLGQEVILKVIVAGDPVPTIQWFKNDMMVLAPADSREIIDEEGRSTLRIKQIGETDLTIYKIVARNKSGQMISRFRLRLSDEPQEASVPESNYDNETTPVHISTDEIKVGTSVEVVYQGHFNSVVLAENSRLLKVCTQHEFDISRNLAHINLFSIQQASQIGINILAEDSRIEYSSSSNLLHYISSLDSYSEQLLCNLVTQILDGLQYLHWQGIALLNLEPGNVIVYQNQRIKLTDFSAAQQVLKIGSRVDCLTDPQFTAPEVLNGESNCMPQTDTWNIGVLIYILLSGVSPFVGETEDDTKQNVTYVRFRFEHLYKTVTQEATRLIMLIFKRSPLKRPTADECVEHRWFQLTEHLTKKREKSIFETTKIKEYYANYLAHQKSKLEESNLQDFSTKYGIPI